MTSELLRVTEPILLQRLHGCCVGLAFHDYNALVIPRELCTQNSSQFCVPPLLLIFPNSTLHSRQPSSTIDINYMGRKRDKERDEEKRLRRRAGNVAKRSLAADLQDDLSSYNDELWTESMGGIESVDREEAGLVEALLTYQSSAPIPKGKKQLHGSSEDEYEDEYYGQYSGSDDLAPKRPQAGPSKSIISIPGQSLLS